MQTSICASEKEIKKVIRIINKNSLDDTPLRWKSARRTRKIRALSSALKNAKEILIQYAEITDQDKKRLDRAMSILNSALGEKNNKSASDSYFVDDQIALGSQGINCLNTDLDLVKKQLESILTISFVSLRMKNIINVARKTKYKRFDEPWAGFKAPDEKMMDEFIGMLNKIPEFMLLIKKLNDEDFEKFCAFLEQETFCSITEIARFFSFSKECYDLVRKNKITYVFSSDRSARIVGVYIHHLLNTNGLAKVSCQFVLSAYGNYKATRYHDEKQAALVKEQNVLVIDEYGFTGGTVEAITNLIKNSGAATVYHLYFAKGPSSRNMPTWHGSNEVSGLEKQKEPNIIITIVKDFEIRRKTIKARQYVKELAYWVATAIKMEEKI